MKQQSKMQTFDQNLKTKGHPMKRLHPFKKQLCAGLAFAVIASTIYTWSGSLAFGDESAATNTPPAAVKKDTPEKKPVKKLTGAELYAVNCNRCHPERYPTEFNSAHWKTLMMHMRVRANLPAKQAKEIIRYLQDESGN